MNSYFRATLFGLLISTVSSTALSDIVSDRVDAIDQLLVYGASSATWETSASKDAYVVGLKPEAVKLLGIRPRPFASAVPVTDVARIWDSLFSSQGEIPALLTWSGQNGETGVQLWIGAPSYDAQSGEFRFAARKAPKTTRLLASLSVHKKPAAALASGTLSGAHLYLDDEQGRVIRYTDGHSVVGSCVIQPYTRCPRAYLAGADLARADLTGAYLAFADIARANLRNTLFAGANMEGASLQDATVNESSFDNAYLGDANLSYSHWSNIALVNTNLRGANVHEMQQANVTYCNVTLPDGSVDNSGCTPSH
ncbi:MAG: pentapeptide repeat-containing protein [Methylococcus sp.]|nr:pentapeptide repeat-containing protein [Methylococcus sp.]